MPALFAFGSFVIFSGPSYPEKLSAWGIFEGKLALLKPKKGIVPYNLNTPLYSDYAEKARLIKLPAGKAVAYKEKGVLDFPVGTLLVKTFYYSADFRKPGMNKNIYGNPLIDKRAGRVESDYLFME